MFFEKMVFYSISDVFILFLVLGCILAGFESFKTLFTGRSSKALLLFFLCALLSLAVSPYHAFALQYFRLCQLFICSLLFYLLANASFFGMSRKIINLFAFCIMASSLFQSVVATFQYFTQKAVGLKRLGELSLNAPGVNPSSIYSVDGSLSFFDHILSPAQGRHVMRAFGTLADPNLLGGFMALSILATIYLYVTSRLRLRFLLSLALFAQVFTLVITFSRSAYLGALACSSVYIAYYWVKTKQQRPVALRLVMTLLLCFILSSVFFYPQLKGRGGYVNYKETVAESSDAERLVYQKIAMQMIRQKPFLGVGFNNYVLRMQEFTKDKLPAEFSHPVHNIFLLIGAETGLLGLALFSFVFFRQLITLFKRGCSNEMLFLALSLVLLCLLGQCSHYLLSWQSGRLMLFIVLGLSARFIKESGKRPLLSV
jgi:hypothetical protein